MIELYFDTAYLCKLRWQESGSEQVATCAATAQVLVCGLHGQAEFYSICHRKLREGIVTLEQMEIVIAQFNADRAAGAIRFLPLTAPMLARIEQVYRIAPTSLFLRAADALHLSCAAAHGFTQIYSNDRHLLAAAPLFGLQGINVIE
jgi:predicted nucleic acid-binding protein